MDNEFFVHILASERDRTLYTWVTSALVQRVWQHKTKALEVFSAKYCVDRHVYFEIHPDAASAILRENRSRNGSAPGRPS